MLKRLKCLKELTDLTAPAVQNFGKMSVKSNTKSGSRHLRYSAGKAQKKREDEGMPKVKQGEQQARKSLLPINSAQNSSQESAQDSSQVSSQGSQSNCSQLEVKCDESMANGHNLQNGQNGKEEVKDELKDAIRKDEKSEVSGETSGGKLYKFLTVLCDDWNIF